MKPNDGVCFQSQDDPKQLISIECQEDHLLYFYTDIGASSEKPKGTLLFKMDQATFDAVVENHFRHLFTLRWKLKKFGYWLYVIYRRRTEALRWWYKRHFVSRYKLPTKD